MTKQLVLVGGGHAHMTVLANLHQFVRKEHNVTVIAPSLHHYYSGMGPGMLGGTYMPDQIRFATRDLVFKNGGKFILDRVDRIDPEGKELTLAGGGKVSFDVVSFNCGSQVPKDLVPSSAEDVFTVKPIEKLIEAQQRVTELSETGAISIVVVGGGPSAVEIAGNLWKIAKNHPVIQIAAGRKLLPRLPEKIRQMALTSLENRGIEVYENGYVNKIDTGRVTLESGRSFEADIIFVAHGICPSPIFKSSGMATGPDGGLLVNKFLQHPDYPYIFGGGDCIYFQDQPLDKVGVYAVRQNPILYHNLMAALEGETMKPFDPGGRYLLIYNLGDGTGIFYKSWLKFNGRLAFRIKDYIDTKFMRKFKSFEA